MADITGILSMCRRAGKLTVGMDEVKNACRGKRAFGVLVASDISQKSLKEVKFVCAMESVSLYDTEMTMDRIGDCLGKRFGIMAVTDSGFMKSMAKKLTKLEVDIDLYE